MGKERKKKIDNCVFSCALLQTDTPPVLNATQCSPGKTGDSEEEVDGGRPEPETILQVCQAQVAELEQWLDKTKVSLGSDPQTPKMQQMVELQLGDCQVRPSRQFAAAIQMSHPSPGFVNAEKLQFAFPSLLNRLHYTVHKIGNGLASVSGAAFQQLSLNTCF